MKGQTDDCPASYYERQKRNRRSHQVLPKRVFKIKNNQWTLPSLPASYDLDPGTDLDLLDAFDAIVPKLRYRHPHDPSHVPDHILSALIGTSLLVPVNDREPLLGEWQRIVLVEFDGPRKRQIAMSFMPEK
jgi:secondary thiamine-phosphate synthase enzyme